MSNQMLLVVIYLVIINFWGYFSMASDKRKAIKHQYRTPEHHLWLVAWLGGAWGSLLGMRVNHHKTKHTVFRLGMPLLCVGHVFLWGFILFHR